MPKKSGTETRGRVGANMTFNGLLTIDTLSMRKKYVEQSKLDSFIEAVINVLIGFGINFAGNMLILPMFGFNVTAGKASGIGLVFTVVSVARSYFIRRYFNGKAFAHKVGESISSSSLAMREWWKTYHR